MAGLPDLLAWLDNKRRVAGRNLSDLLNDPANALEKTADNTLQTVRELPDDPANFLGVGILRNAPLQAAATKHFGRTISPDETGFILDNGTRLDLSGRHYASGYQRVGDGFKPMPGQPDYLRGGRNVDHRELGDLVPGSQWEGLSDFINQTGAVRYMPNTGISVVDTNMPNAAQIQRAVEDFRRSRTPMNVDVDALSGSSRASQEFDRPTVDGVMDWIKTQMKPEAFEYGLKDLIKKRAE